MNKKEETIDWVSIFKALAIILVVIGHSTGKFNAYIYQFHVGAFFFISGYLSKLEQKKFDEVIIMKFFTLIMPYFFFSFCGLTVFSILQKLNLLKYVSIWEQIPQWTDSIKMMFNSMYCDWLGATWFLVSLFVAIFIVKILLRISDNKAEIVFIMLSFFLFNMGYFYQYQGINPTYVNRTSHFLVVQFYFALGLTFNNIVDKCPYKFRKWMFMIIPLNIAIFAYVKSRWQITMDLVSTSVNSPTKDILMVLNGIVFLSLCSKAIEMLPFKSLLIYVGNNTMGILVFHFLGFKVVTCILHIFGITDIKALSMLCPPSDISNHWWLVYVVVSIAFSLGAWEIIKKVKLFDFFVGRKKDLYISICKKCTKDEK